MIRILTDYREIERIHKLFHKSLNKVLKEKIFGRVGYPGGSFEGEIRYSPHLDVWMATRPESSKYWNGFGIGRPSSTKGNSIVGEINIPFRPTRTIAGAFGIEDDGNILLLHRGKIGGGSEGVGKTLFVQNFRGDFVEAEDRGQHNSLCVVGEIGSKYFHRQVKNFIEEVKRIKELNKTPIKFLNDFNFLKEKYGRTEKAQKANCVIDRTHGIVVNALADELRKRKLNVGNDSNRDLFVYKNNTITSLFEVKTTCSTQSLYSAVGQLIIYSIPILSTVKLYIVLPDRLNETVARKLKTLGIIPLYYRWVNEEVVFNKLDSVLG